MLSEWGAESKVYPITPDDPALLEAAVKKMTDAQVRRLPVVDSGRLVGMLSISDLAKNAGSMELSAQALSGVTSNMRRL